MNATTAMAPSILPLPFAAGNLRGLSERLLQSHHQNNYAGAVKRLQAIRTQLAALDWGATPGFVINGLKREELIAANSMTLHELYFACIGGDGVLKPSRDLIAGAEWRDPESVDRWAAEFAGREIVVYCVYGHEVGQSTAARLRDAGISARFLVGGIEAWKAAGLPLRSK